MATIDTPPKDYPPEIIGYIEPWIANPGDTVAVKVSSTESEYEYRLVRLMQTQISLENAPKGQLSEEIQPLVRPVKGRFQLARPGSYALVNRWPASACIDGLQLSLHFTTWLAKSGHIQTIISTLDVGSKTGFAIVVNDDGKLEFWVGTGTNVDVVSTDLSPVNKEWIELQMDIGKDTLRASLVPIPHFAAKPSPSAYLEQKLSGNAEVSKSCQLKFGASFASTPTSAFPRATNFFNGRIDSPSIKPLGDLSRTILSYDFALDMSSDRIVDISGSGCHGVLINAPTRAIKGYDWDASETDWTKAKYGYGAIHFHDDDLDDAAWETDFKITVPKDARSGVYAVEMKSLNGKTSDAPVFFVRPQEALATTSVIAPKKVGLVFSTFTYLAYANDRMFEIERSSGAVMAGVPGYSTKGKYQSEFHWRSQRRKDFGLSCYDVHNDDSGVVFSSSKRPLLNVRADMVNRSLWRPRHLSADMMMLGFLERECIPYEVLTDHDLHMKGVSALAGFNTIITGCHPEYPSRQSYDAYTAYAKQGGNLMYLGGNGFYWVSDTDPLRPHRMEIRRGDLGVRTYTSPGGERVLSLNGEHGCMWRSRGRAPNVLLGVGNCFEGSAPGVPYARTPASRDIAFAKIFDGIGEDELLGEEGLGGGASGDEGDRFDVGLGSPINTVILATSTGHPDQYFLDPADVGFVPNNTLGTQTDLIRSDMTYYENSGGGGVFSVGSINWYCSLGWKDYQNNIAKLTGNVIRYFLKNDRE